MTCRHDFVAGTASLKRISKFAKASCNLLILDLRCAEFVAGAALCESRCADFVAGAALCESQCADCVAGAALCESRCADFVAGAALCESRCADFVAGAALAESGSADFVAGAALCESRCADFVAGTALCESQCADFVAGAVLCERPASGVKIASGSEGIFLPTSNGNPVWVKALLKHGTKYLAPLLLTLLEARAANPISRGGRVLWCHVDAEYDAWLAA